MTRRPKPNGWACATLRCRCAGPMTSTANACASSAARACGPVLIHCASGNRVGAMVALDEALNHGCDLDSALDQGRRAGLQGLEPAVVELAGREGAAS